MSAPTTKKRMDMKRMEARVSQLEDDRAALIKALHAAIGYNSSLLTYDEFQEALRFRSELRDEVLAR